MIDKNQIGKTWPAIEVQVEKGQLLFFAKVIGETNPLYLDEQVAIAAGYSSLPAPPTFGFSLNLACPDPFLRYTSLGIDLNKVLHGEQGFEYIAPICAGDRISLQDSLTDIYDKKDGALEFLTFTTSATNQQGKPVLKMTSTLVVRNG